MENKKKRSGGYALIPFLVFIVIYFVTGIILQNQGVDMAFYQMPAPVAAFVAVISAFIIFKEDLNTK
ncbi:MAG: Na+/H+ antiporter NhaC family protein, partial [Anaerococcus sp.]|nr:Na+/H+ antiporter NhaC family protein [Anaerococcus sp.]